MADISYLWLEWTKIRYLGTLNVINYEFVIKIQKDKMDMEENMRKLFNVAI